MTRIALLLLVCVLPLAVWCIPAPHKQPDGYFMYLNVPRHKEYEAGFNRGNDKHSISRFEQLKGHRFRTRVKWADAQDGYGEHYFEYNHGPKHPEPYHEEPSYGHGHEVHEQEPAYSNQEVVVSSSQ